MGAPEEVGDCLRPVEIFGAGDTEQMGPRGSASPTYEGRDGLPPVREFSPRRLESCLQTPGPHTLPGPVVARSWTAPYGNAVNR